MRLVTAMTILYGMISFAILFPSPEVDFTDERTIEMFYGSAMNYQIIAYKRMIINLFAIIIVIFTSFAYLLMWFFNIADEV